MCICFFLLQTGNRLYECLNLCSVVLEGEGGDVIFFLIVKGGPAINILGATALHQLCVILNCFPKKASTFSKENRLYVSSGGKTVLSRKINVSVFLVVRDVALFGYLAFKLNTTPPEEGDACDTGVNMNPCAQCFTDGHRQIIWCPGAPERDFISAPPGLLVCPLVCAVRETD